MYLAHSCGINQSVSKYSVSKYKKEKVINIISKSQRTPILPLVNYKFSVKYFLQNICTTQRMNRLTMQQ